MSLSIIDEPGRDLDSDALQTGSYAKALAKFLMDCQTPLTIGIQGEWGSGKTTLLKMIQDQIAQESIDKRSGLMGSDAYPIIWVNTWEHSILSDPAQSLISILGEITDEILKRDGTAASEKKIRHFLGALTKTALIAGGTIVAGSNAGAAISQAIEPQMNPVRQLRETLGSTINSIIESSKRIRKFVIFIDDLDRLEPTNAVRILELLKNIFAIENCVFVLAIDYQVVVKGLRGKFGELNDQNEWEFRAFFDKIIQVPFMMPIGAYAIEQYLSELLLNTKLFEKRDPDQLFWLSPVIKMTIGHNPRALKRMINSLSLIHIHRGIQGTPLPCDFGSSEEAKLKALMLSLVAIQISYPRLFEMLAIEPDFINWDEALVARLTRNANRDDRDLTLALERVIEINEDDFDEGWKQALFKVIWTLKGGVSKVVEMSRVMSLIRNNIVKLDDRDTEKQAARLSAAMAWGIKHTALTSVLATDDPPPSQIETEETIKRKDDYRRFWDTMRQALDKTNSGFKGRIRTNTAGPRVQRSYGENEDSEFSISISPRIGTFLRVDGPERSLSLFLFLRSHKSEIENAVGCKLNKIKVEGRPWFTLKYPDEQLGGRGDITEASAAEQTKYCLCVSQILEKLEPKLQTLCQLYEQQQESASLVEPDSVSVEV
jgi:ABC-type dipeptide/oligopeptide/nickel transport system ATPase component